MSRTLIEVVKCDRCGLREETQERVAGTPDDPRRIDISDDCFEMSTAPELFAIAERVGVPMNFKAKAETRAGKVPCKYCDHKSPTKQAMHSHIRTMHQDDLPFECEDPGCDQRYETESGRERHYTRAGHRPKKSETTAAEEHP